MTTMKVGKTGVVFVSILLPFVVLSQHPKLTVYYGNWCQRCLDANGYGLPPWEINWSGIDYVVHAGNGTVQQVAPYCTFVVGNAKGRQDSIDFTWGGLGTCGQYQYDWQDSLTTIAHRTGAKVLLAVNAVNPGEGLNYVMVDSFRTEIFATAYARYARRHHYDGLELNVEQWQTPIASVSALNRLTRILRGKLNEAYAPVRPLLFSSASRDDWNIYYANQDSVFDMHNLQCYNYASVWNKFQRRSQTWFQTPLRTQPGFPIEENGWFLGVIRSLGLKKQALTDDIVTHKSVVQNWIDAGHPRSKIGISIGAYGVAFIGTDAWGSNFTAAYGDLPLFELEDMINYGGTYTYYSAPASPTISGTATGNPPYWWIKNGQKFYLTFDNDSSVARKVLWADSQGIGGFMIYDFKGDMHPGRGFNTRTPTIKKGVQTLQFLRAQEGVR
jgi:GH18 family chitinase